MDHKQYIIDMIYRHRAGDHANSDPIRYLVNQDDTFL